jgi:NAD(P)-dependent dehydrogenase (short-subunit alcohol dehydrogenase family)
MNIANKSILITGANRGIGRALVAEALKRGASKVYAGTRGPLDFQDERVTPIALDVTNDQQILKLSRIIQSLDVLINNAGIALYDDLTCTEALEKTLAVNLFGMLKVTRAVQPLLAKSRGAVVNNLSILSLAPAPAISSYSISKAGALSMTLSLRALLAADGVSVHGVLLGPVDTDMNRGVEMPKASPESAAQGIFDGLARGEEEIFPDPASAAIAEAWRSSIAKTLENEFSSFMPQVMTPLAS